MKLSNPFFTSLLLVGSAGQSGTAAPDLGGGGGRGGERDSDRLEPMFLPRSITDLLRWGSREDPDVPLPGGAFFPAVRQPEADCERVTACVPGPWPLRTEDVRDATPAKTISLCCF